MNINEYILNMSNDIAKQKPITVVDYVKDFKTGEIKKEIKHKPPQSMINKATIQVFDANGELAQEGVSHNVVNNTIKQVAFVDYFFQRPTARGISAMENSESWWEAIYLSDYAGVEDANELFILGEIIGWAGHTQTYSGADTRKGTYNAGESYPIDYKRQGYTKFVYDWPTHAANGTINSVYWGNHASVSGTGYRCYVPVFWLPGGNNSILGVADCSSEGEKFVYVANNQYIYTYDLDFTSNQTLYDISTFLGTSPRLRGIDFDLVEGLWWIVNDTDKKVYKGSYGSTVFNYVFTASDISQTIEGLAFIGGKIFIHTREGVYRYTTTGTLERKITQEEYGFGVDTDSSKGIWNFKGNSAWILIAGYDGTDYWMGRCDQDGNLITKQKMNDSRSYYSYYMNYFCFVRNTNYENSRVYIIHCDCWYWAIINSFGSHTKLAAPVTKNNTQTMKVTYEFNIDVSQIT